LVDHAIDADATVATLDKIASWRGTHPRFIRCDNGTQFAQPQLLEIASFNALLVDQWMGVRPEINRPHAHTRARRGKSDPSTPKLPRARCSPARRPAPPRTAPASWKRPGNSSSLATAPSKLELARSTSSAIL